MQFSAISDLPESVRATVPDAEAQEVLRKAFNERADAGDSELRAWISGYRALESAGYRTNGDGKTWVQKDSPGLSDVHVNRPMGSTNPKPKADDDFELIDVDADGNPKVKVIAKIDKVTVDIPLFIKLLEMAREEIKTDEPLHVIAERVTDLMKDKPLLTMEDFDSIAAAIKDDLKAEKQAGPDAEVPPAVQVAKRISGNSPISLNAKGEKLAAKLGKRIAAKGGLDVLHSSDLPRAIQTADAIEKAATGVKVEHANPTPALRPWRLGEIEGRQPSDVADLVKHYIDHPDEVPPGEGADGKPAESFNAAKERQLNELLELKTDAEVHPTMKIGAVMHSRGMELVQSWVDAGCPEDYKLDEKDLLHPDDPKHADVLRWHGDKVKEVDLASDDELKPGFYLILHSLTDDDTDTGNEDLEKHAPVESKQITKYLPPIEVHDAAQRAMDAGTVVKSITAPLADSTGLEETEVRKVAEHFAGAEAASEPELARDAWGGLTAGKWAARAIKKIEKDAVAKADDGDHWVTIHGQPLLLGADGEIKGGNPKAVGGADTIVAFQPTERMLRAMESRVPCGAKEQKIADEQERIISKAVGLPRTADNSAFDLRGPKVGVEIKTMQSSRSGKITMSKAALGRKESEANGPPRLKTYTVVADKRGGGTSYYIAKGVGSFRVSAMTPTTIAGIRSMVR